MKPSQNPPSNDLEDEVLKSAARDFMGSAAASAPVIDVTPEVRPKSANKPPASKKKTFSLVLGLLAVGAIGAGAWMSSQPDDAAPKSPLLAEIDAASRDAKLSADPATAPAVSEPSALAPAAAALDVPAQLPADAPAPAAEAILPDAAASSPAGTEADPIVVRPAREIAPAAVPSAAVPAPAPTEQPSTPTPPAIPVEAPPVAAATAAELENLRLKVRSLERAALSPTTIEVAEVLTDGVVLRDAQGRTVVVPAGGKVRASAGRVEQR